jgi:hypothetical protein
LSVLKPYLCRCMLVAAVLETGYEWVSQLRSTRTKKKLAGSGRRVRSVGPVMAIVTFALWVVLPAQAQQPNPADSKGRGQADQVSVNWLYGAYVPKDVPLVTLALRQRLRLYVAQTFTKPGIYVKSVLFSAGDQIDGSPPEWGGGLAGYGRRFGSRYGQSLIQNTFAATGNALLGYEPRYDRCRCTGFWTRTRHAFVRNFVTYNRTEEELRPQFGLYAGAMGSGAISSEWRPGTSSPWVEGYQAMITQAGWGLVTNWFGEFAPDILRVVRRKK